MNPFKEVADKIKRDREEKQKQRIDQLIRDILQAHATGRTHIHLYQWYVTEALAEKLKEVFKVEETLDKDSMVTGYVISWE